MYIMYIISFMSTLFGPAHSSRTAQIGLMPKNKQNFQITFFKYYQQFEAPRLGGTSLMS